MASTKSNAKSHAHKARPHKKSGSSHTAAAKGHDKPHAAKAASPGKSHGAKSHTAKSHAAPKSSGGRGPANKEKRPSAAGKGRSGASSQDHAGKEGKVAKAVQSAKDHPLATAAVGAGVGLMLVQGVRKVIGAVSDGSSTENAEQENAGEQADAQGSAEDQHEDSDEEEDREGAQASADDEDQHEQSDDDDRARGDADASGDDDPSDEHADQDESEADSGGIVRHSVAAAGRFGREGVSRVASGLSTGASAVGGLARKGYERGKEKSAQAWHGHPLIICALAIALGAAAGALLPASEVEDKLMGKTANRIGGRLKKAGKKLLKQGKNLAGKTLSHVVDVAAREVEREGLSPQRIGRKIKRVAGEVRTAVTDTLES